MSLSVEFQNFTNSLEALIEERKMMLQEQKCEIKGNDLQNLIGSPLNHSDHLFTV